MPPDDLRETRVRSQRAAAEAANEVASSIASRYASRGAMVSRDGQRAHSLDAGHAPACSRSAFSFPARGSERPHIPTPCSRTHRERSALAKENATDGRPEVPPLRHRRAARPHLAGRRPRASADLVLDRPPRRKPGARQPDGRAAQAAVLRPARPARGQGDRGRLPLGVEAGLRLLPDARRGGADPRPTRRSRCSPRPDRS